MHVVVFLSGYHTVISMSRPGSLLNNLAKVHPGEGIQKVSFWRARIRGRGELLLIALDRFPVKEIPFNRSLIQPCFVDMRKHIDCILP